MAKKHGINYPDDELEKQPVIADEDLLLDEIEDDEETEALANVLEDEFGKLTDE